MATFAKTFVSRIGIALHRTAAERYAEQRGLVERTGLAGMI